MSRRTGMTTMTSTCSTTPRRPSPSHQHWLTQAELLITLAAEYTARYRREHTQLQVSWTSQSTLINTITETKIKRVEQIGARVMHKLHQVSTKQNLPTATVTRVETRRTKPHCYTREQLRRSQSRCRHRLARSIRMTETQELTSQSLLQKACYWAALRSQTIAIKLRRRRNNPRSKNRIATWNRPKYKK